MLQTAKHANTNYWLLNIWFWSDTIIKLQQQDHYMDLWMDPLSDQLRTHPIQMGWVISIKPYTSGRLGCIDNPDLQSGNGSVLSWFLALSDSPEPLLTVFMCTFLQLCLTNSFQVMLNFLFICKVRFKNWCFWNQFLILIEYIY